MALDSNDIAIVRRSWTKVAPIAPMAAQVFYGRLFRIAPGTRPLFASDVTAQGRKLIMTLGFVVDHLDRPDTLVPAAQELAIRHVGYKVTAEHYAPVGDALLWSLGELLGQLSASGSAGPGRGSTDVLRRS